MNYLIASIASILCALITYISLDKKKTDKVFFLRQRSNDEEFESKELSKTKYFGLVVIVSLLSGAASFCMAFQIDSLINLIKMSVAIICVTGAAATDYREHRIPNVYSLIMAIVGLVCLAVGFLTGIDGAFSYVISSLAATVGVALCLTLASLLTKRGIGFGDIKLLSSLALIGGVYTICGTLFFGMIACVVVAVVLLASKRKTLKGSLPFAPFVLIGFCLSIFTSTY